MKYVYSLVLLFLFVQCSNIKYVSDGSLLNRDDKNIKYILKKNNVEEVNKNILYFTSGFDNENIEVKVGNDIVYSEKTSTIAQLSLAYTQVIQNEHPISIKFNNSTVSLNHNNLVKYKFIYISKLMNKEKYLVEYSNKSRIFR